MSPEDKRLLTAEERGLYDAYQELFTLTGWKLLVAQARDDFEDAGQKYDMVANDIGYGRLQGYRHAIDLQILRAADIVAIKFEAIVEERKASIADSLEDDVDA